MDLKKLENTVDSKIKRLEAERIIKTIRGKSEKHEANIIEYQDFKQKSYGYKILVSGRVIDEGWEFNSAREAEAEAAMLLKRFG